MYRTREHKLKFRKLAKDYDPTNRDAAYAHIREHQRKGEVVTGPLYNLPHAQLCPGNAALQKLMRQFR